MSTSDLSLTTDEVRPLVDFILRQPNGHSEVSLQALAEIIGVLIDLKPATRQHFTFSAADLHTFQNLLTNLHLYSIIEEIPIHKLYGFFISRDLITARKLQAALHASLELGWCPDNPEDQKLSYQIGRLLGYPETAAHYFAYGPRNEKGVIQHRPSSDHDRYYIHSPDHFRTEYQEFEDILHSALAQLAPQAAKLMRQNPRYYWISADLPNHS